MKQAMVFLILTSAGLFLFGTPKTIERKTCLAPDGVTIVYSAAGSGRTALVFIHGGLADRSFFDGQLKAFADRYRVIALDLAGHGESGSNRKKWGIPEFGADVKAVADAEKLQRIVLFGNSLGGPVAIEAALLLPGRVIGVVGIDTFQSLDYSYSPEEVRQRAEAFRADYSGSMKTMVKALFHTDADPALIVDAEKRMQKTSPEAAYAIFMGLAGYVPAASARRLSVPLRAINGDLYPTDFVAVRKVKADFDAKIMKHMGHYPMLERPEEFNRLVEMTVEELDTKKPAQLSAGQQAEAKFAAIGKTVRSYMEAIDAGDLDRQMGFWSQEANASSVIMGEVWFGLGSIRERSAQYVPVSRLLRNELGEPKVFLLGMDTALAILPFTAVRRDPKDERLKPFELENMLTLILKREAQDWRIFHEHVSAKVPPPTAK